MLLYFSVPGGDLLSFVTPSNPLDEHQTARFVRHITEALEYLHSHNVILINIAVSIYTCIINNNFFCFDSLRIFYLEQVIKR